MVALLHTFSPKWFALSMWGVSLLILTISGLILLGGYGLWIGITLWLFITAFTLQHFVLFVPKLTSLLSMNSILKDDDEEGTLRIIRSGLNFRYPWEEIKEDSYFSLIKIQVPFSGTFPAKDGPEIEASGSFVISPDPNSLRQYFMSQDITTREITVRVLGFLSALTAKQKAVEARIEMNATSSAVTIHFSGDEDNSGGEKKSLEKEFGIKLHSITLGDIDYEDDFQKARATNEITKTLRGAVKESLKLKDKKGDPIPLDEAWDNVMVIHGKAEKHVQKIEGEGGDAIASLLMAMVHGGGKNVESVESKR